MTYTAVTFIDGLPVLAQPLTDMSAELAVLSGQSNSAWITFNPPTLTWTGSIANPAIGNGTLEGRYQLIGSKGVRLQIYLVYGSTSTGGNGYWIWSLPYTASSDAVKFAKGIGFMDDVSTQGRPGTSRIITTTQVIMDLSAGAVSVSAPVTAATGDRYSIDIEYDRV